TAGPAPTSAVGAVDGRHHGTQRSVDDRRVDAHAPVDLFLDRALDVAGGAGVVACRHGVLGVIKKAHVEPDGGQRVEERRDRTVAGAGDLLLVALDPHGRLDRVLAAAVV